MLRPDFSEFSALAAHATVVPVTRELLSDRLTPVSALATVGTGAGNYLLESVEGGETWARYSFVGFEPAVLIRGVADRVERVDAHGTEVQHGVDPWQVLRTELNQWTPPDVPWLPRFWGGAVGYVSYDAVRRFEPTVAPPLAADDGRYEVSFAIGGTLLVFDAVRQTVRVVELVRTPPGADLRRLYDRAVAHIDSVRARLQNPASLRELSPPSPHTAVELPPSSFERADFCRAVEHAQEYIRAGDIFQVVLSQRFRVPLEGVDPLDIYRMMRVINPSPYLYFLRFPEVTIAGASPETLVRLEDGVAQVRPIAGTRPRGQTEEQDRALERELLADPKERAEHVMLVDLGRNDLGRVAQTGSVRITDRMLVERYSHVMHIVSNVVSKLAPGQDALHLLRATFPAGTLSGAPKVRAMQIIDELEPEPRGIYGGAVGYVGFDGNMDLAIAIRTLVAREDRLTLQAGAGIVEASDPDAEWHETINKARAGLIALGAARAARSSD